MMNRNTDNGGNVTGDTTVGTVNTATWTIEKDGTWSRVFKVTVVDAGTGYSVTSVMDMTSSGTWSFVGKNKSADLKKNDRVSFSTLASTEVSTSTLTLGTTVGTPDVNTNTSSYGEGEMVEVYVVDESKKKALTMSKDENNGGTNTDSMGTNTDTGVTTGTYVMSQL